MSVTPEQYQNNLKSFQQEIANLILNAPFAASNDLQGKIVQRVFNKGLDSNNATLGKYSGAYAIKRTKKGLQVEYKDLQYTGETMESIKNGIGSEEGTAIVGFNNLDGSKKGRWNEEQHGSPVFSPSITEQEEARQFMIDFIREGIKDKAKSILNG